MKLGMYKRNQRIRKTKNVKEAETLAEAFLLLRIQERLTQKQAADLLGTGQNRISEYETGKRTPSKSTIKKWLVFTNNVQGYYQTFMKLYHREYTNSNYQKKNKLKNL